LNDTTNLVNRLSGVVFRSELLEEALAHSSFAAEQGGENNERLEFLGDAVLEVLASEEVYSRHPDWPEGKMTRWRADLVCEESLARVARAFKLGAHVKLGRSQLMSGGVDRPSMLADAVEAIIGAAYLSGGLDNARRLFRLGFSEAIRDLPDDPAARDFKSQLQEYVQARPELGAIGYEVVGSEGPDHDKSFEVEATLDRAPVGRGRGRSKKQAEQEAAKAALSLLAKQ
jgi:ribonuclease-3